MRQCSICHHYFENIYQHISNHVIKGGVSGAPIARQSRLSVYPDLPIIRPRNRWLDHFNREVLELDTSMDFYYTAGTFTFPDVTTYIRHGAQIATGAVIGNDGQIQTWFYVTIGKQDVTKLTAIIKCTLVQTADTEFFAGIIDASVVLSALPTTQSHAGIVLDRSVSANWRTSSGDGAAQNINTTTVASDTTDNALKVVWSASEVAFYRGATLLGTHTTNLPISEEGHGIVAFIQTEAAAAKTLRVDKIEVQLH